VPLFGFLKARNDGNGLARLIFWGSTIGFLVAAMFTNILIHWNAVAYAAVLPFLHQWLRPRIVVFGHFGFSAVIGLAIGINFTVLPLLSTFTYTDQTSSLSYGWDEVVPEIEKFKASEDVGFIAAPVYASASALAFAMHDPDVTSLSPHTEAFDFWFDAAAHRGQNALIVTDRKRPITPAIEAMFSEVKRVKRINVERFGFLVERYTIYIARAYDPPTQ
jgi:hypothetical protein